MKLKLQILFSASAASLLAFAAPAQDTYNPRTATGDYSRQRLPQSHGNRLNGAAKASDLIGMTVKNYQDEKLGKVENLAVDVASGRIVQVIISTGGFLGLGRTFTAVPPDAFHYDAAHQVLHLDSSKAKLAGAPRFDNGNWAAGTQSDPVTEAYGYYGEQPYFMGDRDENGTTNQAGALARTLPRNMDGTLNTTGARTLDTVHNMEIARNAGTNDSAAENGSTLSTRNPDGTWTRKNEATPAAGARLGDVEKGSQIIGATVKNLQDEKLGMVENFMVDLPAGRIVAVIISSGGYLGMGDELSAVPPSALSCQSGHDTLQLDTSKEALAAAPHFKANQWPDLSQPGYVGGVYRAYHVDPYFTTDATTGADNTRRNVRDRDSRTLTPLDQSNTKADISTTTQIRKEIIADKGMSINAQNVKIITIDGRVTLRGPVNSEAEKNLIGEIANQSTPSGNVDNQLEVQANPGK